MMRRAHVVAVLALSACGGSRPDADTPCRAGLHSELLSVVFGVDAPGTEPLVVTTDAIVDGALEQVVLEGEVELHGAEVRVRRGDDAELEVPLSLCPFGPDDFHEPREVERTSDHPLDELGLGPLRAHARCRYLVTVEDCR